MLAPRIPEAAITILIKTPPLHNRAVHLPSPKSRARNTSDGSLHPLALGRQVPQAGVCYRRTGSGEASFVACFSERGAKELVEMGVAGRHEAHKGLCWAVQQGIDGKHRRK